MIEKITKAITGIVGGITDEILAVIIVGATMYSYFAGVEIPTEPLMAVIGFYFGKKV